MLMSFPPATEMFQFAGFASHGYGFTMRYPLRGGLPHSEIPGSKLVRSSPRLFAAYHVLHRLLVPRRSEEHTSELQSLMRISYAVICLKKKNIRNHITSTKHTYISTRYH